MSASGTETVTTFTLEKYALNSYNYFNRMVDRNGLPYFNIFWTEPAEAAHDWPDFGDVMIRQIQGAIMGRHMTGKKAAIENTWYDKMMASFDAETGLLYREETQYITSEAKEAELGAQALTLYTLVTAYLDNKDEAVRSIACKMVDTLYKHYSGEEPPDNIWISGFIIKSLMAAVRHMQCESALKLAGLLVRTVFERKSFFAPDNTFRHGGHMHGNLRTLAGAADYALYVRDAVLFSRIDALYRYVRSEGTRFGFLPESIGRQADIVACETCAIMDFLGLAVTLANHGHPEYWGDVERTVRNHLVESQLQDGSWLKTDPESREDTRQFSRHCVGERMVGGYAGWSAPNHILACAETLNSHWGGEELRNKVRAFQNCCGGSGTHGLFIAWKNAARYEDGCLSVHLLIDKLLPQAEIRSCQPYKGLLTIAMKESCRVRVRIPEFVDPADIRVSINDRLSEFKVWGNYVELGARALHDSIRIAFPLPVYEEEVTIGNPGFRTYKYKATWKGDTVIRMEPVGNDWPHGYSDYDKREVPVYYGREGVGQLYRREFMLAEADPEPAPLHLDDSNLDLWHFASSEAGGQENGKQISQRK